MYTVRNFKSKKALKEAVAAFNAGDTTQAVHIYQPGPFGGNEPTNGRTALEGPHYPEPHRWYAEATLKDGCVIAVK